jgi:hypothetical protein
MRHQVVWIDSWIGRIVLEHPKYRPATFLDFGTPVPNRSDEIQLGRINQHISRSPRASAYVLRLRDSKIRSRICFRPGLRLGARDMLHLNISGELQRLVIISTEGPALRTRKFSNSQDVVQPNDNQTTTKRQPPNGNGFSEISLLGFPLYLKLIARLYSVGNCSRNSNKPDPYIPLTCIKTAYIKWCYVLKASKSPFRMHILHVERR